ncbi:amidohydrolase family protein [Aminobacter ciceronei]|nr:amidohydrolase family protein [Aminobacter ciceronei]
MKEPCDLILSQGAVLPIAPPRTLIFPGSVAVRGGSIVGVGASSEIDRRFSAQRVLDCGGQVILPGLVNVHAQAGMNLIRAYAVDKPFHRVSSIAKRYVEVIDSWSTFVAAQLTCIEFVRGGITTFADVFHYADATAEAVARVGIRATVAPLVGDDLAQIQNDLSAIGQYAKCGISSAIGVSIRGRDLCGSLEGVVAFARAAGVPIHFTDFDHSQRQAYGDPFAQLVGGGFAPHGDVLANPASLDVEDLNRLRATGLGVAHIPSNAQMGEQAAVAGGCIRQRVPVGLGTGSAARGGDLPLNCHPLAIRASAVFVTP